MIEVTQIMTEIETQISKAFPETKIYEDLMPQGFTRPSFLLSSGKSVRTDANRTTIFIVTDFLVTCYEQTDDYYHTRARELLDKAHALLEIFSSGFISVGDRCLKITPSIVGRHIDECAVELKLEYYDSRPAIMHEHELMGGLELEIKKENENGIT